MSANSRVYVDENWGASLCQWVKLLEILG